MGKTILSMAISINFGFAPLYMFKDWYIAAYAFFALTNKWEHNWKLMFQPINNALTIHNRLSMTASSINGDSTIHKWRQHHPQMETAPSIIGDSTIHKWRQHHPHMETAPFINGDRTIHKWRQYYSQMVFFQITDLLNY